MVELRLRAALRDEGRSRERLFALPFRLRSALLEATREATASLEEAAVREIPKRTGRTARTIASRVVASPPGKVARGEVGTTDEVAHILEFGSRPHVIRPRPPRKALRFVADGRVVFARRVDHPGTRAYGWLERAGRGAQAGLEAVFERRVRGAL